MIELFNWLFGQYADYSTVFIALGTDCCCLWRSKCLTRQQNQYTRISYWSRQHSYICLSTMEMAIIWRYVYQCLLYGDESYMAGSTGQRIRKTQS